MKFQTDVRLSCEQNLPKTKWISAGSLDIAFNGYVRLKLIAGIDFNIGHFDRNEFHFGW